jgi:hypothetical protein
MTMISITVPGIAKII